MTIYDMTSNLIASVTEHVSNQPYDSFEKHQAATRKILNAQHAIHKLINENDVQIKHGAGASYWEGFADGVRAMRDAVSNTDRPFDVTDLQSKEGNC